MQLKLKDKQLKKIAIDLNTKEEGQKKLEKELKKIELQLSFNEEEQKKKDMNLKIREEEQETKDQKELIQKHKEQKLKDEEEKLKKDFSAKKIKEWENKFDEEQRLASIEGQIKDVKIKQRDRLRQVIGEQSDRKLQDELFSKLEAFEVEKEN